MKFHIISKGAFSDRIYQAFNKKVKKILIEVFTKEKIVNLKDDQLYIQVKKDVMIGLRKLFKKLKQIQPIIMIHIV